MKRITIFLVCVWVGVAGAVTACAALWPGRGSAAGGSAKAVAASRAKGMVPPVLSAVAAPAAAPIVAPSDSAVQAALARAGANKASLAQALDGMTGPRRAALGFLIAHMPPCDLTTLSGKFLASDVNLAFEARRKTPWGHAIPQELFLNDVLPYANLSERRDDWRGLYYRRLLPVVKGCRTPAEAAMKLDATIYKMFHVSYNATKRHRPDQGPLESMRIHYASCTGLSVMLIDACRSVCVPARAVGTPSWAAPKGHEAGFHGGNHTWVEIWDGQWYFLGAGEPGPLDHTWFVTNARRARVHQPLHSIYAASFAPTGGHFWMIWRLGDTSVPGLNVTRFYTQPRKVRVQVRPASPRVQAPYAPPRGLKIEVRWRGRLIALVPVGQTLTLPAGETFNFMALRGRTAGPSVRVAIGNPPEQTVVVRAPKTH